MQSLALEPELYVLCYMLLRRRGRRSRRKKKAPNTLLLPFAAASSFSFTDKFLGKIDFTKYLHFLTSSSTAPTRHLQPPNFDFSPVFPVPQDVSDHCLFSSLLPRVSHGFSPIPLRPFFSHLCQLVFLCLGLLIVLVPQASSCAQVSLPLAISLGKFICSQCLLYTNSMLITLKCIFWLQLCLSASSIHEIADWRFSCLLV